MSLICSRSLTSNISHVDVLYKANRDMDNLYLGSGMPPLCSSTHPPPPPGCTVCFQRFVYAVCSDLLENVELVMEGDGQTLDLKKSECPGHFATKDNADFPGDDTDAWKWWLLISLILIILIILISVLVTAYRKYRRNKLRGGTSADSS